MLSHRISDQVADEPAVQLERRAMPRSPRVVVSVGTDHHPFDRLISWIDRWSEERGEASVLVQRGASGEPEHVRSFDLIAHAELCEFFARADVVISHGGPSTVMDARKVGRFPIVVPRDPSQGEHIDGHQMRFGNHLEKHGLARLARTESEFVTALDEAMANPEAFAIGRASTDAPPGVMNFGASVDALLGIVTPITVAAERERETS